MADKALINYIRSSIAKGAEQNSLRIALIRNGYPQDVLEAAFREAQHIEIRHTIHFSPPVIGLLIALLFAAVGFGYFIFSSEGAVKQTALLDLNLEPIQGIAAPGEDLIVLKEVTNMGSARGYDVELKTELVDGQSGSVIAEKTETRAVETIGSTQTRIAVPLDANPGSYILRTIAEYQGKRAVASIRVTVAKGETVQEPTEEDATPNQEEESEESKTPDETKPQNPCVNGIRDLGEQGIDCGGNCRACPVQGETSEGTAGLKRSLTLDEIRFTATTNAKLAMQQCAAQQIPDYRDSCFSNVAKVAKDADSCAPIINERIKDVCFSEIAKSVQDPAYCDRVSKEDRRDSCYLTFVLDYKDYSVCEKVVNENLRQSCLALRGLGQ